MRFGQLLRQLRTERNIPQKNLASLAGISPTLLSNIEQGKKTPAEQTGHRLIEVLGPDERTREMLIHVLEEEFEPRRKQIKESFVFGPKLKKILDDLHISIPDLAIEMDRPVFTVRSWADGSMLPSDVTLTIEIIRVLKKRGVDNVGIQELKVAHLQDILARSLRLDYVGQDQLLHLVNCITDCIAKKKDSIFA